MLDKLSSKTKLLLLSIILFISLAMALFLPAITTFYIFYPILVLSYLTYLTIKQFSGKTIFLNTLLIILGTIFTLGMPWLLSFILFIHIFPTYLVALTTLIIMTLLPLKKYSIIVKISIFIFISIIVGLNTNLLVLGKSFLGQDRNVNEIFNKKLNVKNKEFIEINTNAKNIPIKYNKFDFLSFGFNEGCMCGYWEFPRINRSNLIPYILGNQGIAFSWTKSYDKKIIIDYHETQRLYSLDIKILQKDKLLSSLTINDYLPFQSIPNIDRKSLNNFDYRLEYLLHHNIWNAILYYSSLGLANNKKVIYDFLKKSININGIRGQSLP